MIQGGATESPTAHSAVLGSHTLSFHHLVLWFLPIIPHLKTKNFQVKQINAEWNYFIPNPLVFHNISNEYSIINPIDYFLLFSYCLQPPSPDPKHLSAGILLNFFSIPYQLYFCINSWSHSKYFLSVRKILWLNALNFAFSSNIPHVRFMILHFKTTILWLPWVWQVPGSITTEGT